MGALNTDNFINKGEITREEFDSYKKINDVEEFTPSAISKFIKDSNDGIQKGENNEFDEENHKREDIMKAELKDLRKVTVVEKDLNKSLIYFKVK